MQQLDSGRAGGLESALKINDKSRENGKGSLISR
jgi:hypothetical protein